MYCTVVIAVVTSDADMLMLRFLLLFALFLLPSISLSYSLYFLVSIKLFDFIESETKRCKCCHSIIYVVMSLLRRMIVVSLSLPPSVSVALSYHFHFIVYGKSKSKTDRKDKVQVVKGRTQFIPFDVNGSWFFSFPIIKGSSLF